MKKKKKKEKQIELNIYKKRVVLKITFFILLLSHNVDVIILTNL
jgi:hypothetical protein